jgi:hypothetical protein
MSFPANNFPAADAGGWPRLVVGGWPRLVVACTTTKPAAPRFVVSKRGHSCRQHPRDFPDTSAPPKISNVPPLCDVHTSQPGRSATCYSVIHAQAPASVLRSRVFALYHDELLSAAAAARQSPQPRSVSPRAGAGAAPVSLCGCRICGHARARASASGRARARRSFGSDESAETGLCPMSAPKAAPSHGWQTARAVADGGQPGANLAASVLRFRGVLGNQAWRSYATCIATR